MKFFSIYFVLFIFLLLIPLGETPIYAAERDTILTLDSAAGFQRVGQEMTFKGTLKTTDNYNVAFGTILIKTNSNLNNGNVIASGTTDARGKFTINQIVEDWGDTKIYAVFLGNSEYDSAISQPKSVSIRQAYSYEPAARSLTENESINLQSGTTTSTPALQITSSPTTYGTELILSIQRGSESGYAKVYPTLTLDNNSSLNLQNIEILVDRSLVETVPSNKWSNEIFVGSGKTITASFPTTTTGNTVYTLSQDTINIPKDISIPASISENIQNFARSWDWGSVIAGLIIGAIIKILLEHWAKIKTLKNIAFIIGALVLIGLFAISEDNNISENLDIFDPEQLIPTTGNPNYFIFGILISYIFGWIKEILRDIKIWGHPTQRE